MAVGTQMKTGYQRPAAIISILASHQGVTLTYSAEKKQDNCDKTSNTTNDSTPENSLGCIDTCILGLLGHVTRSIKPDQNARSCKIG